MTKFATIVALAASLLAAAASAQAAPDYGHAQRDAARAGLITTGGVFDGR